MHAAVWGLLSVGILGFVLASAVPLPSVVGCNVDVTVQSRELPLLAATYFSINGVSAHVTGAATLLDWSAWLSVAPASATGSFTMTVKVGPAQATRTGFQLFPSVPLVNGGSLQATNTIHVAQVPVGEQAVSVTLTDNGQTVATGSSSLSVGC